MFKKVIWATDGSEGSDLTLPLARTLADDAAGKLLVVHCVELTRPGKGGGSFPAHADEEDLAAKIERQVAELSADGVEASLQTARTGAGGAAHMIAEIARDEQADVIVVGTRGHTPLAGLLVGSVTQRLLHIAPCPVLAVPTAGRGTSG